MKIKNYTRLRKGSVLAIEQICAVVLALALLTSYYYTSSTNSADLGNNVGYLDSSVYRNRVVEETNTLLSYLTGRSKYEKNGVYDPNRIVDIQDYAQKDLITGENTHGVAYKLSDLLNWAQSGIDYYSEFEDGITPPLYEKYTPIGYESILEFAKENDRKASDYYYYLSCTVENIWDDVWKYNQYKNNFLADHTNIQYLVLDADGNTVYSNTGKTEVELESMETYIVLDFLNRQPDTSLNISNSWINYFNRDLGPSLKESKVVIAVNTEFPVEDEFLTDKSSYELWMPLIRKALVAGMISVALLIISGIYLTIITGHVEGKKGIVLMEFDKIPVEISILLAGIGSFVFLVAMYYIVLVIPSPITVFIGVSLCVICANSIVVAVYLSLVRRIKTAMFWKNSLLVQIALAVKDIIDNRQSVSKTIAFYLGFLCVNIGLVAFGGKAGRIAAGIFDLLVGQRLIDQAIQRKKLLVMMQEINEGDLGHQMDTRGFTGENQILAQRLCHLETSVKQAVDSQMKSERLKTDLITNVSHDIKTPLTSIINYVDLMKREDIPNEKARNYLDILDQKSQRLKHLTEDLVEASKISSGNIELDYMNINFKELILQTNGEFAEKFENHSLELICHIPKEPLIIWADGRRIWRVVENLYGNAAKYAMEHTRVYVDIVIQEEQMLFSMKNISKQALNIDASELTERFIRGDVSRSTEGSGLGLSIAKNLTILQGGKFEIYLDGDLFKVMIRFPLSGTAKEIL